MIQKMNQMGFITVLHPYTETDIIIDIPPSDSVDSLIDSLNKAAGIPTDGDINNGNLTNKNFNDAMYNSIP